VSTENKNLKKLNQELTQYSKEKGMVKVEDFKEDFLQSCDNFASPLIQIYLQFSLNFVMDFHVHGFVKKSMRIGIVGSRSAP
jgi:hypothetical protein